MNSLVSLVGYLGAFSAFVISVWAAIRYALIENYRLSGEASKLLYERIVNESSLTWILKKEYVKSPKYPEIFESFARIDETLIFFSRSERLLTAGWQGKENFSEIFFFRWDRKRVEKILDTTSADTCTISLLLPSGPDLIGEIEIDPNAQVFLNEGSYEDIERDVQRVISGEIKKTSFLLYGEPGGGKSQFVKYISKKYKMPVNIVYLQPDYTNVDIVKMFAASPRNSIILIEDFDTYFNKRECLMSNEEVKFTFDSIINSLDGVHNDYRGIIFVMTANEISKIDDSLKLRPSRFKFVREFKKPNEKIISRILGHDSSSEDLIGRSLDEIFNIHDAQLVEKQSQLDGANAQSMSRPERTIQA